MHILPANRPPSAEKSGVAEDGGPEGQARGAGSSFKAEREQQRKGDAGEHLLDSSRQLCVRLEAHSMPLKCQGTRGCLCCG